MMTKRLKYQLFEYIVFQLDRWYQETNNGKPLQITKLRLQKVLFLLCAVNATNDKKGLLTVFTNFAALPLGPVEIDIYDAMNTNQFAHIHFNDNMCMTDEINDDTFATIDSKHKEMVDEAIAALKTKKRNYLTMPVFELVEITHQWTSWQTAKMIADIVGSKREAISADDICNSAIKAY